MSLTSAQIRRNRIKKYINRLKLIDINSIIRNLSSDDLKDLIERAKHNNNNEEIIIKWITNTQLNIVINDLTDIEKSFLKSQNIALTTYRSQITEYRKEITRLLNSDYQRLQSQHKIRYKKLKQIINQKCLVVEELEAQTKNIKNDPQLVEIRKKMEQIQDSNPVSKAAQIALFKMTAGQVVHNQINRQYEETKRIRQEAYKLIDQSEYINIAEGLLNSYDYHELILGICAMTGRRQIEVVKTGHFELNSDYSLIFTGQVKKRKIDQTSYEIPVLCLPKKIIVAHKRLKKVLQHQRIDYENSSNRSINNRLFTSPKSSGLKQEIFATIYPGEAPPKFSLRSAYAAICYEIFQPDMSFIAYTAKILNHKNLDSATSYDQYKPV